MGAIWGGRKRGEVLSYEAMILGGGRGKALLAVVVDVKGLMFGRMARVGEKLMFRSCTYLTV